MQHDNSSMSPTLGLKICSDVGRFSQLVLGGVLEGILLVHHRKPKANNRSHDQDTRPLCRSYKATTCHHQKEKEKQKCKTM